jgi:hypothetical protein
MVDYSIDIKDEGVSYEQAVRMPSASDSAIAIAGVAKLGDGVFKTLDALDAAKKRSAPTDSMIKRAAFGELSQEINATKGLSPLNKRTGVNAAIIKYTNSGFEVGQAEKDLAKMAGVDIDYIGFDPAQAAIDGALKVINENPAHLKLAQRELNSRQEPYTQQDLLNLAITNVQSTEAAALYIVNSQITSQVQFQNEYLPHANKLIRSLEAQIMAGLSIEMQAGKNIMPENIMELEVGLTQLRSLITSKIPPNLPEGTSRPLIDQLDVLKTQLDNLKNYDKNVLDSKVTDHIQRNTEVMLEYINKNVKNPILKNAMLSGNFDPTVLLSGQITELSNSMQNLEAKDMEYIDLFTYNPNVLGNTKPDPDQPDVDISVIDNSTDKLHDPDEVEKATDMSLVKRKDVLFFTSLSSINLVEPKNMNVAEHRDNFLQGIGHASVVIAKSPEIFKADTLNNIFNENMFKKLSVLDQIDPNQAAIARARLGDALVRQLQLVNTAVSGSDTSSYFKVTGLGQIEYDLEKRIDTGQIRMDRQVGDMVKMYANKRYNGDITAMIADRGRKLETLERSQIEDLGFKFQTAYADYRKVLKNSDKKKYYIKNLRRLGVLTGSLEQSLIQEVEVGESSSNGSLQNPWVIEWTGKRETDLKIMASIGSGEHYFDSAGAVRVKK